MIISVVDTNALLDAANRYALRLIGTSASGYGYGGPTLGYGAASAAVDVQAAVLAMTDLDPVAVLASSAQNLALLADGQARSAGDLSPLLGALQTHVSRYGLPNVRNLSEYLVYRNTAEVTKWQCLQHPQFQALYTRFSGGQVPAPSCCYFEVLQGATYTLGLARLVVGSGVTAGATIDGAVYAGGFPQLNVSGLTGSGLVTVTGSAFDPATKAAAAGRTWTATVSANGVTALSPGGATPAPTASLITAVSALVAAGGITAGTIYVEATRPAGRPLLQ